MIEFIKDWVLRISLSAKRVTLSVWQGVLDTASRIFRWMKGGVAKIKSWAMLPYSTLGQILTKIGVLVMGLPKAIKRMFAYWRICACLFWDQAKSFLARFLQWAFSSVVYFSIPIILLGWCAFISVLGMIAILKGKLWDKEKKKNKRPREKISWKIASVIVTVAITLFSSWHLFVQDGEHGYALIFIGVVMVVYTVILSLLWATRWSINIPLCVYANTAYALSMGYFMIWRTGYFSIPVGIGLTLLDMAVFAALVWWMWETKRGTIDGRDVKLIDGKYFLDVKGKLIPVSPQDRFDGPYSVKRLYLWGVEYEASGDEWLNISGSLEEAGLEGDAHYVNIKGCQGPGNYFVAFPGITATPIYMGPRRKKFEHSSMAMGKNRDGKKENAKVRIAGSVWVRVDNIARAVQLIARGEGFTELIQDGVGDIFRDIIGQAPGVEVVEEMKYFKTGFKWSLRVGKLPLVKTGKWRYENLYNLYVGLHDTLEGLLERVDGIKEEEVKKEGTTDVQRALKKVVWGSDFHPSSKVTGLERHVGGSFVRIEIPTFENVGEELVEALQSEAKGRAQARGIIAKVDKLIEHNPSMTKARRATMMEMGLGKTERKVLSLGDDDDNIMKAIELVVGGGKTSSSTKQKGDSE